MRQTWTLRERWLGISLVLVSVSLAVEWVGHRRSTSAQAISWDKIAEANALEMMDAAPVVMEPLSDEADPGQARSIHVPGAAQSTSNVIPSEKPATRKNERHAADAKADKSKKAADKKEGNNVLTQQQIESTLATLEAMDWGPDAEKKLSSFIQQWGKQDPVAALEYALGIESNKARDSIMKSVFGAWMKQDPGSARQWFNQMLTSDPLEIDSLAGMVFKDKVGSNPGGVIAEISKLPGNGLKRNALSAVVNQMLAQDNIEGLFAIHTAMTPGLDQDLLTEAILKGAGIYQPTVIADWALTLQDSHARKVALDGLVGTWSADQPISASEWVMNLQDDAERSRSIAKVAQNWAREDAVATGDWLLSMRPPDPSLDPALVNFVKAVMKENPSGAMAWAGTITDEKQRTTLMAQVGKQWVKSDSEGAMAYVSETPLPSSVQKAMISASTNQ